MTDSGHKFFYRGGHNIVGSLGYKMMLEFLIFFWCLICDNHSKPYHSSCALLGCWMFPTFKLHAEKIQSDPFAPPSLFRVIMDQEVARYPEFTNRYMQQKI